LQRHDPIKPYLFTSTQLPQFLQRSSLLRRGYICKSSSTAERLNIKLLLPESVQPQHHANFGLRLISPDTTPSAQLEKEDLLLILPSQQPLDLAKHPAIFQ
jgi:hypothetical protein